MPISARRVYAVDHVEPETREEHGQRARKPKTCAVTLAERLRRATPIARRMVLSFSVDVRQLEDHVFELVGHAGRSGTSTRKTTICTS
jgi:hypothetical protein